MLNLLLRWLSGIGFKLTNWKVQGQPPHHVEKFVMIVAPHTSSKDFYVGIAARSVCHLEYVKFLGKVELFKFPLGIFIRALGGYPVDRSKNNNLVDNVVEIFKSKERFSIALAPEGTRKRVKKLRSGFYHIAKKAGIPIVIVGFDFKKKLVDICEPFYPTENSEEDMKFIWNYFTGITGANPELGISPTH